MIPSCPLSLSVFLQLPLDDSHRKRLEYEFHSAGYHAIMEVVTGLRTAVGHLIREVRCVCACVHACVRACVCMRVNKYVYASVRF